MKKLKRQLKNLIFVFNSNKDKIKSVIYKFFLPILVLWFIIHIFFGVFVSLSLFGEVLSIWHTLFITIVQIATYYTVHATNVLFEKLFPKIPKKVRIIKTIRVIDVKKVKKSTKRKKRK